MASKIVAPKAAVQLSDAIYDCLAQASAIIDLIRCSAGDEREQTADDSVPLAAMAARNMIEEAQRLASNLFALAKSTHRAESERIQ